MFSYVKEPIFGFTTPRAARPDLSRKLDFWLTFDRFEVHLAKLSDRWPKMAVFTITCAVASRCSSLLRSPQRRIIIFVNFFGTMCGSSRDLDDEKAECACPGSGKEAARLAALLGAFVLLIGLIVGITYVTLVIFERQNNFAGALAFAFVIGWPLSILFLPVVMVLVNLARKKDLFHDFDDPYVCPCHAGCFWWPSLNFLVFMFAIFAFIVMTTFAVRLVPFLYLYNNMADINVADTGRNAGAKGFIFKDATLNLTGVVRGSSVAEGERCRCTSCSSDECCTECVKIRVNVKYCLAPVRPKSDSIVLDNVPAAAICFWFPCRSLAYWEGSTTTTISDHDWDKNCQGDPSYSDCMYECGPDANMPSPAGLGLDGLTILNGVKIYGRHWASNKSRGIPFRVEDASPTFKYGVPFSEIFNQFDRVMVPQMERSAGKLLLRTPEQSM